MVMTYEELVAKAKKATQKMRVSKEIGHVAYQFNVVGEAQGAFYLEIADGKIHVEPYEYYDRDVIVVASADVIIQMLEGELQPMAAYTNEQLKAYGDVGQLKMLPLGSNCTKYHKK